MDFLGQPVEFQFANINIINSIVNVIYSPFEKITKMSKRIIKENLSDDKDVLSEINVVQSDPLKILNFILIYAKRVGASDIHFEYDDTILRIRIRVNGILQEKIIDDSVEFSETLFRIIKLQSQMDISITHIPQDGRINTTFEDGTKISARVSVAPNVNGASCVIRLFADIKDIPDTKQIFSNNEVHGLVSSFTQKSQGMLLITGPTGSGKTTSLYSIINEINDFTRKTITIEDPVEIIMPRINQIEVVADTRLDFAEALKACLRQDPDIVLLGEIRDENTANIALRAAITGHLVFSTLHTNSTIATITRLFNLNLPGYLISDGLSLVVAQRLLKKICNNCKKEESISLEKLNEYEKKYNIKLSDTKFFKGMGCNLCGNTGVKGRKGIFEILPLNDKMKILIAGNNLPEFKEVATQFLSGAFIIDGVLASVKDGVCAFSEFERFIDE